MSQYKVEAISAGYERAGRLKFPYVRICLWRFDGEGLPELVWQSERVPASGKTEKSGLGMARTMANVMRERLMELDAKAVPLTTSTGTSPASTSTIYIDAEQAQPQLFAECGKRKLEVTR